ncbi:cation transporter dimerization domain-containing protein [Paenibacillus sp. HB172176]|uniref:cation transporter dimerization domain-containing protein n=1 Tax=Paenibacillus sp. HB172176 TaxID=2493690 RepID=UPI00143B25F3|nr:cation transporter dimerization domain-containing protein [Paenibacillus sp. HB172176]
MSSGQRNSRRRRSGFGRFWESMLGALSGRGSAVRNTADLSRDAEDFMQIVQRVEGVVTVESLRAREQGHYVIAEIVISVNPRISVLEGQEIANKVKLLLMHRFLHLSDVSIHVEPYNPGYPYKSNHDPNQEQMPTLLQ